nr:MAG TPA: hypothetical protein [Caudoviricetes sp.]
MKYIMTDYVKHTALANTHLNNSPEFVRDHMGA